MFIGLWSWTVVYLHQNYHVIPQRNQCPPRLTQHAPFPVTWYISSMVIHQTPEFEALSLSRPRGFIGQTYMSHHASFMSSHCLTLIGHSHHYLNELQSKDSGHQNIIVQHNPPWWQKLSNLNQANKTACCRTRGGVVNTQTSAIHFWMGEGLVTLTWQPLLFADLHFSEGGNMVGGSMLHVLYIFVRPVLPFHLEHNINNSIFRYTPFYFIFQTCLCHPNMQTVHPIQSALFMLTIN